MQRVKGQQARVARVRGTARVRIKSPQLAGSVTEFIAVEKPDRVRLETYDFFGNVASVLVSAGERFAFYDAATRTHYRGTSTPENISKLLPVVLPAPELVAILCGSAPILEGRPLSAAPADARMMLVVDGGDGVGQRLGVGKEFAVESSRIRRVRTGPDGAPVEDNPAYDLDFDHFRHHAGVRFPTELALRAPAAGVKLDLAWREDLEVNPALEPELFVLEPPRGAKIVDLAPGSPVPDPDLPLTPEASEPRPRE